MSETLDLVRGMVKKADEEGRLVPVGEQFHPDADPVSRAVYDYVVQGHQPMTDGRAGGPRLQGATDAELQRTFAGVRVGGQTVIATSVRWVRWRLAKAGYVCHNGHQRERGKVWVRSTKDPLPGGTD